MTKENENETFLQNSIVHYDKIEKESRNEQRRGTQNRWPRDFVSSLLCHIVCHPFNECE
ncbi:hypothetical protein RUM43_001582, partial [Polyplax serrata]